MPNSVLSPVRVTSPAKLNLMLHITGRRADGYHELQTLFQLLDYGDTMVFTPIDNTSDVQLTDNSGLVQEDNLVWRAAELLRPKRRSPVGLRIHLEKVLPMGGGLGGGSSNAATTLLIVNHLWQCGLSIDALAELGRELGADVPVFVRGTSAWAEGVGEQLTAVDLPEAWFVVAHPDIHVSTADIFNSRSLTRNSQKTTIRTALAGEGRNDCEATVREQYPAIANMLDTMHKLGPARLTGTGACGFISFNTEAEAQNAAQQLARDYAVFVAQGINRSPVASVIDA
ncbi:4-(cytidine 5'-diphospho)-2-C-methyl-D-erythritol kinase [Salinispirillum sp. LH 10-3-1]|uniref:4-diphosphocytidyl-2-C-methyl-D-erythritol kinase n=1 Tax=Salinispirillum sp. LH 10-3-1 TaxID=2952525 RepID=A0AB38YCR2_9GAMM